MPSNANNNDNNRTKSVMSDGESRKKKKVRDESLECESKWSNATWKSLVAPTRLVASHFFVSNRFPVAAAVAMALDLCIKAGRLFCLFDCLLEAVVVSIST